LKREVFSRTSLLLSVWSRRVGWMEVTAKGMMRARNNRLGDVPDDFDVSDIIVYRAPNSGYSVLVEHDVAVAGDRIRAHWLKYAGMALLRDFLSVVWRGYPVDEDDAWQVFNLLSALAANAGKMDGVVMGVAGVLKMLTVSGVSPQMEECVACGARRSANGWLLAYSEGGIICRACVARLGTRGDSPVLDQGLVEMVARLTAEPVDALGPIRSPSAARVVRLLKALGGWCDAALEVHLRGFAWLADLIEDARLLPEGVRN
jgi:recombinational DNA repair protein (RecF pathway)